MPSARHGKTGKGDFRVLFRKFAELRGVELVETFYKSAKLTGYLFRASLFVRLDVERHKRLVQRKSEQEPAVAVFFVEIHSHALEVRRRKAPALLVLGVFRQPVDDFVTVWLEILKPEVHSELAALGRFPKPLYQRGKLIAVLPAA